MMDGYVLTDLKSYREWWQIYSLLSSRRMKLVYTYSGGECKKRNYRPFIISTIDNKHQNNIHVCMCTNIKKTCTLLTKTLRVFINKNSFTTTHFKYSCKKQKNATHTFYADRQLPSILDWTINVAALSKKKRILRCILQYILVLLPTDWLTDCLPACPDSMVFALSYENIKINKEKIKWNETTNP